MKPTTVHAKTAAGQQEIAQRSTAIDARHRTLLIMIDGRRSFADLARMMGGPQMLEPMLARLEALGMIASATPAPAPAPAPAPVRAGIPFPGLVARPAPAAAPPPGDADWIERRARAVRMLNDILGPTGDGLAVRMEALKSPEQLPELIERGRELIADFRGQAAAERFEAAVKP